MMLRAQTDLKRVLSEYFQDIRRPVAWCTSAGPVEILRALGFTVYFPENHGALLGATRTAEQYIPVAHQHGYGAEVCSYLTADVGAWIVGETPLTKAYGLAEVPKPDLIVYNTNQCREVAEWFNFFGRAYSCPVVGIHPPRHVEEISKADIENVSEQFSRLIDAGERVIGSPMDPDAFRTVIALSREGSVLWGDLLRTAKNSPAPLTFFDGCILMAPIVLLRGTVACNEFYSAALAELTDRVMHGTGALPGERTRLFWDGMPIWGRLRALSDLFTECEAPVVASTYCNSWILDDLDPDRPLESMAYAYTNIFINRGENAKLAILRSMVEEYRVAGMVFHDAKTCFNNSNNRFGLPARLRAETGIGTMVLDGDLNDPRFYSDGQSRTRIETFIEQLSN